MRTALFYGSTPYGKRIHLGDDPLYMSGRIVKVNTFCGAIMSAWEDGDLPPPRRVAYFCHNCFRALAWEVFVERMESLAAEQRPKRRRTA